MDTKEKKQLSKWLDKTQKESWQLELLISGFAIMGLFQVKSTLFNLINGISLEAGFITATSLGLFYVLVQIAWYIFTTNLIIHLFIRGLWIGTIGLRSVSEKLDYQSLNYNKHFTSFFTKNTENFDDYINKLERFASVVFAFTFLLFFIFMSFLFYTFVLINFVSILSLTFFSGQIESTKMTMGGNTLGFILLFILLLSLIVFIDFVSLGALKKVKQKHFAKFYYTLFRVFSVLTLSFIWRPLLLNFFNTKFTKRLFLLTIPYIVIIAIILPSLKLSDHKFYPELERGKSTSIIDISKNSYQSVFYDDERNLNMDVIQRINIASIPSKIIRSSYIELFISASYSDDSSIYKLDTTLFPISKVGIYKTSLDNSSTYNENENDRRVAKGFSNETFMLNNVLSIKKAVINTISIKIDNSFIDNKDIFYDFYRHPNRNQKGLLAFVPLDSLKNGRHLLVVFKNGNEVYIPFMYLND